MKKVLKVIKSKNVLLGIALLLIVCSIGLTYAFFNLDILTNGNNDSNNIIAGNLDVTINDSSVVVNNLEPIYDEDYLSYAYKKTFALYNNGTLNGCSNLYIDISSMSSSLNSQYVKYKLVNGSYEYSGNFSEINNNKILLSSNIFTREGASREYTLYLWISYQDNTDQTQLLGTSLSASIYIDTRVCESTSDTSDLVFDAQGGSAPISSVKITSDMTYGTLPIPTKNGYTFDGWYTFPKEYQEVEYIMSIDRECCINTGIKPTANFEYEFIFENGEKYASNQYILGTNASTSSPRLNLRLNSDTGYDIYLQGSTGSASTVTSNTGTINNKYHIKLTGDYTNHTWHLVFDNIKETSGIYNPNIAGFTTNIRFFNYSSDTSTSVANMKVYYFSLKNDGLLVRKMIPCYRKSDNVIGMYDTVNNVFYTNSGSGSFSKGDNIVSSIVTSSTLNEKKDYQKLYAWWTSTN